MIRASGDVLPTLLVNGYVAGAWRGVQDGIAVSAWACGRYDRWWTRLPHTQVQTFRAQAGR